MKIVVDFSENEIAFDDDNEVCEAVHQADLDRDGNHLAEATKLTPEKATGTKVGSLEGRQTQNTPRNLTWRRE